MSSFQQFLLGMFLVIVGVNVLGSSVVHALTWQKVSLNDRIIIASANSVPAPTPSLQSKGKLTATPSALYSGESKVDQTAFDFIVESFQGKLTSVEDRLLAVEKKQAETQASAQTVVKTTAPIKEQTVYIGLGSSTNTDWTDVNSAQITLNAENYPNVEKVVFEATLSIVGGEARARLKNKTTGGVIYPSEVKHTTSTATTVVSGSFLLASGSNEYVVQLRSSSNELVVLDGARLRLFYR